MVLQRRRKMWLEKLNGLLKRKAVEKTVMGTDNPDLEQVRQYFNDLRITRYFTYQNVYGYDKQPRDKVADIDNLLDTNNKATEAFTHRVCFGEFLTRGGSEIYRAKQYFHEYRHTFISIVLKQYFSHYHNNNFTWLRKDQLEQHLDYCKEVFGFDFNYKVEERVLSKYDKYYPGKECYRVLFDFKNLSYVKVKLLLFWYRLAVEFPSNLALIDALELKRNYFPEEELYNLLLIPSRYQVRCLRPTHIPESQSISIIGGFVKRDILKERLQEKSFVNDLFEANFEESYPLSSYVNDYFILASGENNTYLDRFNVWFSKEEMDKRFNVYKKLYGWYKKYEVEVTE